MEAEAAEVRGRRRRAGRRPSAARRPSSLDVAVAGRQDARAAARRGRARRWSRPSRAVADRREGLAKLAGQVNALRTRAAAAEDEIARLRAPPPRPASAARAGRGRAAPRCSPRSALLDAGEVGLDDRHERRGRRARGGRGAGRASWPTAEREAERERSTWTARADALAVGLTRKDGAGALLGGGDAAARRARLGGRAAHASRPGYEAAVAAALGAVADAVAVDSLATPPSARWS